jgi:hypothetical protein
VKVSEEHQIHLELIVSNFAVESGSKFNFILSPSIYGEMSVATTLPFGITFAAAVTAGSPIPVAISKTL